MYAFFKSFHTFLEPEVATYIRSMLKNFCNKMAGKVRECTSTGYKTSKKGKLRKITHCQKYFELIHKHESQLS